MDEQLLPCPFCGDKKPIVNKTYNEITHGRIKWDGGCTAYIDENGNLHRLQIPAKVEGI